jgi:hypothetical protein
VAAVTFLVNGQAAFTASAAPYQFTFTVPAGGSSLTLGAIAVDFGDNTATAANVIVNLVPDPLTTVVGRVVDANAVVVPDATVTTLQRSAVTQSDGTFSIAGVPTVTGAIVVSATTVTSAGVTLTGRSANLVPVPSGTTSAGDIVVTEPAAVLNIVPADSQTLQVANCIPFGTNTQFGFSGFIYRNVPAFQLKPGGHLSFDLGSLNDVDIRRNIYLAVASANPAAGGNSQNISALGWTKVVSDSQVPLNPRGDFVRGNYELTYTAEAPFDFTGGGFIVGFGGSPPGAYADQGCEQVLVGANSADSSGFFHRRFYFRGDQPMEALDSGNSDTGWLGGIVIKPNR